MHVQSYHYQINENYLTLRTLEFSRSALELGWLLISLYCRKRREVNRVLNRFFLNTGIRHLEWLSTKEPVPTDIPTLKLLLERTIYRIFTIYSMLARLNS